MQIITITSSNNRSGGTRQALYQTQEFADRGYNVTLCLPHNSSFWDLPKHQQKPFWKPLPQYPAEQKIFIESLFLKNQPVLIHAFHNKAIKKIAWWGLSWRRQNVFCVAHRGVVYRPRNPLPYLSPATKAFIVNSQACKRSLLWHCPNRKIRLVANGIPTYRITPKIAKEEIKNRLQISSETKMIVGFIGNNKAQKGFSVLIQAFAKANIKHIHLIAIGVSKKIWASYCESLGIGHQISILDHVEHIADYAQIFDVFAFPSQTAESSPNTLLEAMCMGIPTIATNVGGTPELATNNGLMVPSKNVPCLAEALVYMWNNPEKRALWGKVNLLFGKKFSIQARCDALETIYHEVITHTKH